MKKKSDDTKARIWLWILYPLLFLLLLPTANTPQQNQRARQKKAVEQRPPTLGLEQGMLEFDTPEFTVNIVRSSQTLAALRPKGTGDFDFTPSDLLERRASDGFHHLGDLNFRIRTDGESGWKSFSTATSRQPVKPLPVSGSQLASADLSPTLGEGCPLRVTRSWELVEGKLMLKFELENESDLTVHVGALGIPMIFNNILSRRSLEQAHQTCSFFDPYIGMDAGYLQVTRLSGSGPAMIVVPSGQTPFEAFRPLREPMRSMQTFEGAFEWMVHSQAYAEEEWRDAEPWNEPTHATLAPGAKRTYSVKYLIVPQIRDIEKTVQLSEKILRVLILSAEHMTAEDIEKDTPAMKSEKEQAKSDLAAETIKKEPAASTDDIEEAPAFDESLEAEEPATVEETEIKEDAGPAEETEPIDRIELTEGQEEPSQPKSVADD